MKKLLILLLFIPALTFGQTKNIRFTTTGDTVKAARGGTDLTPWFPLTVRQNLKDVLLFDPATDTLATKDDMRNYVGGGSTDTVHLRNDIDLKIPYTGATTNVDLGDHSLTMANKISVTDEQAGIAVISGTNTSNTTASKGLYGLAYGSSNGTYYGGWFQATHGNTGENIAIYGYASNTAPYRSYAGYFNGDVRVTKQFILDSDTCKGVQTKSVLSKSSLRVTAACTLNGLSDGNIGQILYIVNTSATTLVLKHNGSGTQKFFIAGAGDLTLDARGDGVTCIYDGDYWFVVKPQ